MVRAKERAAVVVDRTDNAPAIDRVKR